MGGAAAGCDPELTADFTPGSHAAARRRKSRSRANPLRHGARVL